MDAVKQSVVYEYPVRRAFDYNGTAYEAGDMWQPGGFRNDALILEYYVDKARATAVQGTPPPPISKRGKR